MKKKNLRDLKEQIIFSRLFLRWNNFTFLSLTYLKWN